jgi:hypothetical protein
MIIEGSTKEGTYQQLLEQIVNNPPLKQRASKEPKNLVGCYFNSSVSYFNLLR